MATAPENHLDWASAGTATEPSAGKKATGYQSADKPPYQEHNWIFKAIDSWLKYLEQSGSEQAKTNFLRSSAVIGWNSTANQLSFTNNLALCFREENTNYINNIPLADSPLTINDGECLVVKKQIEIPLIEIIEFDIDFVTGNSINMNVGGVAITTVPFNTSNSQTYTDLATEIASSSLIATAVADVPNRRIVVTSNTYASPGSITSISVTGGASQAVGTVLVDELEANLAAGTYSTLTAGQYAVVNIEQLTGDDAHLELVLFRRRGTNLENLVTGEIYQNGHSSSIGLSGSVNGELKVLNGGITISPTESIAFDGATGNVKITESTTGNLEIQIGGTNKVDISSNGLDVSNGDVRLDTTQKLILNGSYTARTYITAPSTDTMQLYAGTNAGLGIVDASKQVQVGSLFDLTLDTTKKLVLNQGTNTSWITESSPGNIQIAISSTSVVDISASGLDISGGDARIDSGNKYRYDGSYSGNYYSQNNSNYIETVVGSTNNRTRLYYTSANETNFNVEAVLGSADKVGINLVTNGHYYGWNTLQSSGDLRLTYDAGAATDILKINSDGGVLPGTPSGSPAANYFYQHSGAKAGIYVLGSSGHAISASFNVNTGTSGYNSGSGWYEVNLSTAMSSTAEFIATGMGMNDATSATPESDIVAAAYSSASQLNVRIFDDNGANQTNTNDWAIVIHGDQ